MSNKRFLKKLLATTAVVGTLATGAMEAQAAVQTNVGDVDVVVGVAPLNRVTGFTAANLAAAATTDGITFNELTGAGVAVKVTTHADGDAFSSVRVIVAGAGAGVVAAGAFPALPAGLSGVIGVGHNNIYIGSVTKDIPARGVVSVVFTGGAHNAIFTGTTGVGGFGVNDYSGLGYIDFNNTTSTADFSKLVGTTVAAPLVWGGQILNSGGPAGANQGTVAIGGSFMKLNGAAIIDAGVNQGLNFTVTTGGLTIDSTNGAFTAAAVYANANSQSATFTFTGAAGQGAFTFNATNGNDITISDIDATTLGAGKVVVTGANDFIVLGLVGHTQAIDSLNDNNGAAAMGARTYTGLINAKNNILVGSSTQNTGIISVLGGATSSAGSITLASKGANLVVDGAGLNAATGVTITQAGGVGALNLNGQDITTKAGGIAITTSNAWANPAGALTAIAGNVNITAAVTPGQAIGKVQTKKLTFDTPDHNVAVSFTFGGDATALGSLALANTDANNGMTVTIADGASSYIGDVAVSNNKNTLIFSTTGAGNKAYIGNVGSAANSLLELRVANTGNVIVVDGSTVFTKTINFNNAAAGTLVLGNNVTINASAKIDTNGKILLRSTDVGAADAVTGIMTAGKDNPLAAVVTTINTNSIGQTNALTSIDYGTTGDGSKLTINGVAGTAISAKINQIKFSTTAGAKGTLAITGGSDHTLELTNGAGVTEQVKGSITSDTAGTLTINATIGLAGNPANRNANALAAISATAATNIVLNGKMYVAAVNTKGAGSAVTLSDHSHMIGALTEKTDVAFTAGAANSALATGTNLGNFGTLTLTNGVNLTLQDQVNLTGGKIAASAANNGTITILGNSNITPSVGSADLPVALVQITPSDDGAFGSNTAATVSLGAVYSKGGVAVSGANFAATVNINGSILATNAAAITGTAAQNSSIVFTNAAGADKAITLSGDIAKADANNFKSISVGAGTVNVQNATTIATNEIKGTAGGSAFNFTGVGNNSGLNNATITGPNEGTLTISFDGDITRTVGGIGTIGRNSAIVFNLTAEKTIKVGAFDTYANFTTSKNNMGAFVGGVAGKTVGNIGTKENMYRLAELDIGAPAAEGEATLSTTVGDLYATVSNVGNAAGGSIYNVGSTGGTVNLVAAGDDAKSDILKVAAGSSLGDVRTAKAGLGGVVMTSGTIAGQVGEQGALLAEVGLFGGAGDVVKLSNANVYAHVLQGASTLQLTQNSTIRSGYVSDNSTIELGSYAFTTGDAIFAGTTTINGDLNFAASGGVGGAKMTVATLDVTNANAINGALRLNLDSAVELPKSGSTWDIFTVVNATPAERAKIADMLKLTVLISGNDFLELTGTALIEGDSVIYRGLPKRNASKLVADVKANSTSSAAASLAQGLFEEQDNLTPGSDASILLVKMGKETPAKRTEALRALVATNEAPLIVTDAGTAMNNATGARLSTLSSGVIPVAAGEGASAGDNSMGMGAWISVLGAQGNQGARKGTSGFKSRTIGGVVGFDTALNDQLIIGAAAGTANVKAKFKNDKSGDTVKANTYLFSIYGSYDFGNDWIAQGSALFGNGSVKTSSKRVASNTANETATGKFDTMTAGAEVLGGYKFKVGEASTITPLAGLGYTKSSENNYKETGTSFQNLSISDRTKQKLEGILGLRAATSVDMDDMIISPEFHAFMNYDFKAKAPKVDVKLDGYSRGVPTPVAKPARLSYNLGAGVMVKSDMVEYGVAYDSQIADKYFGHQGTLKLRVNF